MTRLVPGTFASEVDAWAYGDDRLARSRGGSPITGRVAAAEAGRYHLYLGWASAGSHRVAILRELYGLTDVVSASYVDSLRDGRGWAFRARTGPDPLNGFTLLGEAYPAGYAGEVRVPLLWDRAAGQIVSDDTETIAEDLTTAFGGRPGVEMAAGPAVVAASAELDRAFREELNAATALHDAAAARAFVAALQALDTRLARSAFLLGPTRSDADLRLWVRLARLDAGPNATGQIGPRLDRYPNLWRWAHGLYRLPAFRAATDFARFAVPLADLPPWDSHAEAVAHDRVQRSA